MDIFNFALEMEMDARDLYRELESKTDHPGLKNIFGKLAEDEENHSRAIEILKKKLIPGKNTSSIEDVKTIFRTIKENLQEEKLSEEILPELRRALDIEKKGREFYEKHFSGVESKEGQKLFTLLSRQEQYHYETVSNLIELIEKPNWWVEHAEFTPQGDDYY